MHGIQIMAEDISLPIRKILKNTHFTQLQITPKLWNFCLPNWKSNIMSIYYEPISYNSSPDNTEGTTSLLILPFRKSFRFFFFCINDGLTRTSGSKKEVFACAISQNHIIHYKIIYSPHQSCLHLKIMFSCDIIHQSLNWS